MKKPANRPELPSDVAENVASLRNQASALIKSSKKEDQKEALRLFEEIRKIEKAHTKKNEWNNVYTFEKPIVFLPPLQGEQEGMQAVSLIRGKWELLMNDELKRTIMSVRIGIAGELESVEREQIIISYQGDYFQNDYTNPKKRMALKSQTDAFCNASDSNASKLSKQKMIPDDSSTVHIVWRDDDIDLNFPSYGCEHLTGERPPLAKTCLLDTDISCNIEKSDPDKARITMSFIGNILGITTGFRPKIVGSVRDGGQSSKR